MDKDMREKAAKTAVDGFIVVERIYRHAYQTIMALKDKLKAEHNLKAESPVYHNYQSGADPESWLYHFRGFYLANTKVTLEVYNKKEVPILFIQASLYNPNGKEPVLRYGLIERIFNISTWKGARFDDYFRMTLIEIHAERQSGHIKTNSCEAKVRFDEKPLLDIREDKDIVSLAGEIVDKYGRIFKTRPSIEL